MLLSRVQIAAVGLLLRSLCLHSGCQRGRTLLASTDRRCLCDASPLVTLRTWPRIRDCQISVTLHTPQNQGDVIRSGPGPVAGLLTGRERGQEKCSRSAPALFLLLSCQACPFPALCVPFECGLRVNIAASTIRSMATHQRTTRPDKGRIILTARDWSGLRFAAEMYAVRLDHLGQLFAPGLEPAQQEAHTGPAYPVGEKRQRLPWPRDYQKRLNNVYDIARRWVKLGFARLEKPFLNAPMWCWVTKRGLEELGLAYDAGFPALADLAHIHQVNHVRLTMARASQTGNQIPAHKWISERALAVAAGPAPTRHRPDGALQLRDGGREAVEVELTRKSYQRLHDILSELTAPGSGYSRVWYVVSDSAAPALVEAHAQLDEERQHRVVIYRL
jgi:hypothetical protein